MKRLTKTVYSITQKKKKKKILGEIPFFFLQNCLVDLTEYPLTLRYIASSFARITL